MLELSRLSQLSRKMMIFTVAASAIGSLLEMYDFVIYIIFSGVIAQLFFPSSDSFASLLATLGVFAVGYFARPIGGILIGHLTDKLGRRKGLALSVSVMGLSMILIAICPTHAVLGDLSAAILILCRILQGLSVGGEFPTASTFIVEHTPFKRRGFMASWIFFGINIGILLATLISYGIMHSLSPEHLSSWGWRIAFGFGGILAFIGYWIRRALPESPIFNHLSESSLLVKSPLFSVLKEQKIALLRGFFTIAIMATAISAVFLLMPKELKEVSNLSLNQALLFNSISLGVFCFFIPIMGALCDRIGRSQEVLFAGALAFFIFSYPLFYLLTQPHLGLVLWAVIALGIITALTVAPIGFALPEMFYPKHRSMGVGLSYNLSYAFFGGLTPLALTLITHLTTHFENSALVLVGTALLSMLAILTFKKRDEFVSLKDS